MVNKLLIIVLCSALFCSKLVIAKEWTIVRALSELNTPKDEFAPYLSSNLNDLIFSSNESGYSNFYISQYNSGSFTNKRKISGSINKKRNNQSYLSFSNEKSGLFTTYNYKNRKSKVSLFSFNKDGNNYNTGIEQQFLVNKKYCGQPTFSKSGNKLVFVAENENSKLDLYIVYKNLDGSWATPEEIKSLNTSDYDEMTPSFSGEDTLYFSTAGYGGEGGLDVFYSVFENGSWGNPTPLKGINTEFDDTDFKVLNNSNLAIYSSNSSNGSGGLDLYLAELVEVSEKKTPNPLTIELITSDLKLRVKKNIIKMPFNFIQNYNMVYHPIYSENPLDYNFVVDYLKSNPTENLTLLIRTLNKPELDTGANSKYKADLRVKEITDRLIIVNNIEKDRVLLKYEYVENLENANILLLFENNLNAYYPLSTDTISLLKSKVDFKVSNSNLNNVQAKANIGGISYKLDCTINGNIVTVDLQSLENKLENVNELVITISCNEFNLVKDYTLDIIKQSQVTKSEAMVAGKSYEIYPFAIENENDLSLLKLDAQILKENSSLLFYMHDSPDNTSQEAGKAMLKILDKSMIKYNIVKEITNKEVMKCTNCFYLLIAK
jgi:hypothetical protein